MKKLLLIALLTLACISLQAVPAKKGKITLQRGGKTIVVENHGDEYHSFLTDASGKVLERVDSPMLERVERTRSLRSQAQPRKAALGSPRIPVILASFDKTPFSVTSPVEKFSALLNERGYSDNGATGSVLDYYSDNSGGRFTPVFEVYGPVQVSGTTADYGHSKGNLAYKVIYEACTKLDSEVDFSRFDSDGDGQVDMILLYYAGRNAAETADYNTIWPHQAFMEKSPDAQIANNSFDGVHLNRYFCTSELKGTEGTVLCGIGTTCHEFAHSLGVPDFYDTDNEGSGGYNLATAWFSIMSGGSYNNDGNTPPYFNAIERGILGWMDSPEELADGTYTLKSISENCAYKSLSNIPGEYFIYECRDQRGWDEYIAKGLIVYHVDQSDRLVYNRMTAKEMWDKWISYNNINAVGGHPCLDIVRSAEGQWIDAFVFPGYNNVTTVTPLDWDNNSHGLTLSDITYSEESAAVSFKAAYTRTGRVVKGVVTDYYGDPVKGAEIRLSLNKSKVRASQGPGTPPALSTDVVATTYANGSFSFPLSESVQDDFIVTVHKNGYVPSAKLVTLHAGEIDANLKIREVGQIMDIYVSKLEGTGDDYLLPNQIMVASRFTPEELGAFGGGIISGVDYFIYDQASDVTSITAIVQNARTNKVWTKVDNNPVIGAWAEIDISSLNIPVPSKDDYYIGFLVDETSSDYVYIMEKGAAPGGLYYSKTFNPSSPSWKEKEGYKLWLAVAVRNNETVVPGHIGVNVISAKESYTAGEKFVFAIDKAEGREPESVQWTFDSVATSAESVVLLSGNHTVEALLSFPDGTEELLILEINVK